MDAQQMEQYKQKLIQVRAEILNELRKEERKESFSERSGEHPLSFHLADQGGDYNEYEKTYLLASMEGDVLKQIDEALSRIEDGTYGQCVICGEEIHPKRLEAVPHATLCLSCKEKQEKGIL